MRTRIELQRLSLENASKTFDLAANVAAKLIVSAMNDTEQTIKFRTDMAQLVLDRGIGKTHVIEDKDGGDLRVSVSVIETDYRASHPM